jgi:transcriptional regulator with XRE-family HTH domain
MTSRRVGKMRLWLKEARTNKGLTMKDIASKLGISESYYCAIENGERQKNMDLTLVSGLSAALGISVSRIVKYEKEKT